MIKIQLYFLLTYNIQYFMKKLYFIVALSLISLVAKAAYPQTLPIDYTSFFANGATFDQSTLEKGTYTTSGDAILANQWNRGYSIAGYQSPTLETSTLNYSTYINNSAGKSIVLNSAADAARSSIYSLTAFSTASAGYFEGSFYLSALINVSSAPSSTVVFLSFDRSHLSNTYRARTYIKSSGSGYVIGTGLTSGPSTYSSVLTYNQTYLIVIKLTNSATTTEGAYLYVNPIVGDTESNNSSKMVGTGVSAAAASLYIKGIDVIQNAGLGAKISGLRFSNNWADVVKGKIATPTVGAGSLATSSGFTANWAPVTGATSYDVYVYEAGNLVGNAHNVSGQSTSSLIIAGLNQSTAYTYKVVGKGNGSTILDSDFSTTSSEITTIASGLPVLDTPTNGTASTITAVGFTANWIIVNNAQSYDIKLYNSVPTLISTTNASGQATNSTAINGLSENTSYTYTVTAIGDGLNYTNSNASTAANFNTITLTSISTPTINAATGFTATGFTANWTTVTNASSYNVKLYQGATIINTFNVAGQTSANCAISGLTAGQLYTYTVTAIGDGLYYSNSSESAASNSYTSSTPALLSAFDIRTTGFTAYWVPTFNAASYDVKLYQGGDLVSTTTVTGQTSSSLVFTGLFAGLIYTYTVTSSDGFTSQTSPTIITLNPSILETFSDWNAQSATGAYSITKKIFDGITDGTFTSNNLIVSPSQSITSSGTATGNGRPTAGRLQIGNATNYIQLPVLLGISTITTKNNAGTTGSGFKLQSSINGTTWVDISGATVSLKQTVIEAVTFNINTSSNIYIRMLPLQGGSIYFWDLQVNPYVSSIKLSTPTIGSASEITGTSLTANWSTVLNALGYYIKVYNGSNLVSTTYADGQTTTNASIVNLIPNSIYTYKVIARGNVSNYSSSDASDSSNSFTTSNTFAISGATTASSLATLTSESGVTVSNGATLTIDESKTLNSVTVESGGKLNTSAGFPLSVATLTLKADKDISSFSSKIDANITATTVRLFKTIDASKWYFMSFPCNVEISAITKSNGDAMSGLGTDWFVKYYDGNKRSNDGVSNGTNWVSVTSGTLTAKKGYIFGLKTGMPETELLIPLNPSILLAEAESTVPVLSYSTGIAAEVHKGWNLVGQPFLSRFAAQTGSNATFMIMPNNDGKTYTVTSKAFGSLPQVNPFAAYFVQSGLNGNITFGLTGRQSIRSLVANNISENLQLNVTTATGNDDTYLVMDNDQSTTYQIGQDMEKWIGTGTDKPQIYSMLGGINYAFNALPMNSVSNLPIGIYTKILGATRISVNVSQAPSLSKLLLKDNSTGTITDLLATDYNFIANEGTDNSRFEITAQRIPTGDAVETVLGEPNISMVNGKFVLDNINGKATVKIYDAIGHLLIDKVAKSSSMEIPINLLGLYIVKIEMGNRSWTKKTVK